MPRPSLAPARSFTPPHRQELAVATSPASHCLMKARRHPRRYRATVSITAGRAGMSAVPSETEHVLSVTGHRPAELNARC